MNQYKHARSLAAALIGLAVFGVPTYARAEIKDYEFQLVNPEVKVGPAVITVRLINKVTGKAVPDAVIFASRLDMAPDGMAEMATRLTAEPAQEPGTYSFRASVTMAGGWQLSLGARIQGETATLENKLVIKAVK